jgi:hypothetical protein
MSSQSGTYPFMLAASGIGGGGGSGGGSGSTVVPRLEVGERYGGEDKGGGEARCGGGEKERGEDSSSGGGGANILQIINTTNTGRKRHIYYTLTRIWVTAQQLVAVRLNIK